MAIGAIAKIIGKQVENLSRKEVIDALEEIPLKERLEILSDDYGRLPKEYEFLESDKIDFYEDIVNFKTLPNDFKSGDNTLLRAYFVKKDIPEKFVGEADTFGEFKGVPHFKELGSGKIKVFIPNNMYGGQNKFTTKTFDNPSKQEIEDFLETRINKNKGGKVTETFETSIPRFVDRLAKLSMEDVALSKNRDKFIQEEIREKVKIGNRLLENNMYTKDFFDKAIKDRRRELAEEASPLGARSGRATMLVGGQAKLDRNNSGSIDAEDFKMLRASKQEGGDVNTQMEMMLGGVEEVEEPMLPDEEMEEDYVDYVVEETLSNEDRNYLIDALEKDDRLSEIFDQVVESATEFTGAGTVEGPGTGKSDSIPARLSDGEFVFTAKATEELGADNLMSMMREAEREADERLQAQEGGLIEEEETVTMPVEEQPVQQDIRVTKETVGAQAAMQEQSDLVDEELKKSMLSTRPYVRS